MKNFVFAAFLLLTAAFSPPGAARADQRSYVWTYEYQTLPRGEAEIEAYTTLSAPAPGDMKGKTSAEHKLELELGMTQRFDFAVYQVFAQGPGEGLEYKGFQLRARYRIGEKGRYFLDPLVYLEYKGVPDFSEHGVEAKLILARDLGRWNVALNPTLEVEFGDEDETELEYALGARYAIGALLRAGVEATGGKDGHYLGPVVSHGNERYWVALGSAFKLGAGKEDVPGFRMRLLLGIGL